MKARIKSNGKIVEVISRFMPRKRNAASRDWVCNLSDDTCIDESQLEYIEESIEGLDEVAEEYANKHYSKWDESWDDYNGHNVEPENDKLQLMDAFIAGAKWQKEQMMKDAVEGTVMDFSSNQPRPQVDVYVDPNKYCTGDKVRIIVCKKDD